MGTLAGNLMLKHAHNDFPSDVFVILEAVGASIVTIEAKDHVVTKHYHPSDWLKVRQFNLFGDPKCMHNHHF
jgi:hypothetical protein